MNGEIIRCPWAERSPLECAYHDRVWGVPLHDEQALFGMLCLEGMQAGLSWVMVLRRMGALRMAFDDFDPKIMAGYDERRIEELMGMEGIIRNRLKIRAMVGNARAYWGLRERHGTLEEFLWRYVDFTPQINAWCGPGEVPSRTPLSERISRDLKGLGFRFVGPTIVYAFMQATGMVNDHLVTCAFRRVE